MKTFKYSLVLLILIFNSCGETLQETIDLWEISLSGTVFVEVKTKDSGALIEGAVVKLEYILENEEDFEFGLTNKIGRVSLHNYGEFKSLSCNKVGYEPYYIDNVDDFKGTILLNPLSSKNDSDNDGVNDNLDFCPNTPYGQAVDSNGCSNGQKTFVPDDNFEQVLIDLNYDDVLDDYMATSLARLIKILDLSNKDINNLTGIEAFENLSILYCSGNQLTSIDVSSNTVLKSIGCENNQLTSLDVSSNTVLKNLYCGKNLLTSIDISNNFDLTDFYCKENQLTSLDVSKNTDLAILVCSANPLTCIKVSQEQLDNIPTIWFKDDSANYSLNCN